MYAKPSPFSQDIHCAVPVSFKKKKLEKLRRGKRRESACVKGDQKDGKKERRINLKIKKFCIVVHRVGQKSLPI